MRHEIKKITKIVDEVITFCMCAFGATNTEVSIERAPGEYRVRFLFQGVSINTAELSDLEKTMAVGRNPELEDYYWQLAGETESSNELELIAMMSDSATVEYHDGILNIALTRKL